MARIYWALCCGHALTDMDSKRYSLIEVVEYATLEPDAPGDPNEKSIQLNLQLVCVWGRSDPHTTERGWGRVGLRYPDGTKAGYNAPVDIDLTEIGFLRHTVDVGSISFNGEGVYEFLYEWRESETAEWTEKAAVPMFLEIGVPSEESPTEPAA